ncbi:patatin-like phospholipase family protein [Streptomyces beijiangensis]|uniref:Patatin-like phospholipase family protein n=1 Tax=Streptomyces beijiangensis TaxID=163361 RepID=A0A939F441_9ACTN|nr:patatin-like phospholipase family protein [Streptomyces beijiangensis]MBO0511064.1 patatin-like phospholipase family protein [Streptomyces beijiangensis]
MTDTALVLGAGGLTGVGWEIGILYGLAEAGTDLSTADLVIGSSAGAVVGAQLTSGLLTLSELYERQLADPRGEIVSHLGAATLLRFVQAALTSRTPEAYAQKLARMRPAAGGQDEAARREVIARRLVSHEWPARPLRVTAVDAVTGELRVFEKDNGVPVVDAVAASCAVPGVWPAVTAEGRKWIDGGVHSCANAQLAAGYARVVVIAPNAAGGGVLVSPRRQAARLAAEGARVEVITPDAAARKAFGRNVLDPARRAPAARAGLAQASAHAEAVAALWTGGTMKA